MLPRKMDLNALDKLEKYVRWQIIILFAFTINFAGFP